MTLLFDENLSPSLVRELAQEFPRARHVRDVGLRGSDDRRVWDHARQHACVIVSKDTDFRERSYVEGLPPKVVWLDVGNGNTRRIVDLLRRERRRVEAFIVEPETSLLILSITPAKAV